jgi:hypothetical protein
MSKQLVAPREGTGLHQWILWTSRDLLVEGYPPGEVENMIRKAVGIRTTQDVETEIQNAVEGAREFLEDNPEWSGFKQRSTRWVDPLSWVGLDDPMIRRDRRSLKVNLDPVLRKKISTYRTITLCTETDFTFGSLFGGIEFWVCGSRDERDIPVIQRLSKWTKEKLDRMQFVVPNYFRSPCYGRCDFGIGERLFMVVEFDDCPIEEQLSYLDYLGHIKLFPLAMIVFSGHRSAHGWYCCYGQSEHRVKTFCIRAKQLGADKTTYSPSQYVRMPLGWNYKHKTKQEIWYLDQEALEWQNELVRREAI